MIKRHDFVKEKLANRETLEYYQNRIQKSYSRLSDGKNVNLYNLKNTPLDIARTSIIRNSDENVYSNLELTFQMGLGHFKRAIAYDSIEVSLNGLKYNLSALEDSYGASFYDWFFLFSLSNIIRSEVAISELVDLDMGKINSIAHPFWSVVVSYIKGVVNEDKEAVYMGIERIRQATNEGLGLFIDENQNKSEMLLENGSELLSTLWSPILEMYDNVFYGNVDQFNFTLKSYLLQKKEYIINQKLEDDPKYWVDFPALGVCAYAIDQGFAISVKSEYIPSWLYLGNASI